MKKFSNIIGATLTAVVVMVVFAACQKDQSTSVTQDTAAVSSEQTQLVGVAGSYGEGVTPSYASALASNYYRKYDDGNQAQYVVFDAATLSKFIAKMQVNGSTKIYVNFGVYGRNAPALNSKDNGRLTVFFTGDKIPAPSSRRGNDGIDESTDEFLNHGTIYP